jgi:hypothetical protein
MDESIRISREPLDESDSSLCNAIIKEMTVSMNSTIHEASALALEQFADSIEASRITVSPPQYQPAADAVVASLANRARTVAAKFREKTPEK